MAGITARLRTSLQFIATAFNYKPATVGAISVLRVKLAGMTQGFVWLNGHNLGRYPERTPAPGIWLPPCWLKAGPNELVVFDEAGHAPNGIALTVETGASRLAQIETKGLTTGP